MLIPTTLTRIRKGDYSIKPFTVYKDFVVPKSTASSIGYTIRRANYYQDTLPISSSKAIMNQAPTSSDGTYNYQNWNSLYHLYYRNPYDAIEGWDGFNENDTSKLFFLTASLISIPYYDLGQGVKKGSVILSGSSLYLKDDGKYNLYDNTIDSSSFMNPYKLDAYWGFQDGYHKTKLGRKNLIHYNSNIETNTRARDIVSEVYNVNLSEGVLVNNTGSGAQIDFTGIGWVQTPPFDEINYEKSENFTISFWLKAPVSQSSVEYNYNSLINKRSFVKALNFGAYQVETPSGTKASRQIVTASLVYDPTDTYPYDFSIYNQTAGSRSGQVVFKRSDGSSTLILSSSTALNDNQYHNVCVTKSGSGFYLYVDGDLESSSTSDVFYEPTNDYYLLFGAKDKVGYGQYSGSLDEIRFYSTHATATQVSQSLAEKTQGKLYQTRNVGNIFYKRGDVVITSPIKKYHEEFNNTDWSLIFKNTYIIYEYNTLVRIKAGKFNKTMNPSSKKSPKSEFYMDAFTTGSLLPYATTVGLYNENFELVAVGKLARPLKMRSDVAINLVVQWDY